MTTIILVILGVLLAAAAVLFVIYYGGDAFGNGHVEAEAGRLVGEGAQMEAALELFYRQEGHYPTSDDPVAELIAAGYLTHQPLGTRTTDADRWAIDYDASMIRARLGTTDHEETMSICRKAREQLDLPATNTSTGVYRCDGTDSPGGRLSGREPCCIGEVAIGGGAVEDRVVFPSCNGSESATERATCLMQSGDYVSHAGRGVQERVTSLSQIGDPAFDYTNIARLNSVTFLNDDDGRYRYRVITDHADVCDAVNASGAEGHSCVPYAYQMKYYLKDVTADYRPAQISKMDSEFRAFEQSVASAARGTPTTANTPYAPSFNGIARDNYVEIQDRNDGSMWARTIVDGAGLCNALRSQRGDDSMSARSAQNSEIKSDCGHYSRDMYFYWHDITEAGRAGQIAITRREFANIENAIKEGGIPNPSLGNIGYTPNSDGTLRDDLFEFVNANDGRFYTRDTVGYNGYDGKGRCNSLRKATGDVSVDQRSGADLSFDLTCYLRSGTMYWYMNDITDTVRPIQIAHMQSETQRARSLYEDSGLASPPSNPESFGYTANFRGVGRDNYATIVSSNGKYFLRTIVDGSGFCNALRSSIGQPSLSERTGLDDTLQYDCRTYSGSMYYFYGRIK